jgi:hypothetical protein
MLFPWSLRPLFSCYDPLLFGNFDVLLHFVSVKLHLTTTLLIHKRLNIYVTNNF